jgi:PmbA protein
MLGADTIRTGKSPLGDKIGELIASTGFSLFEEGLGLSGFPICPFDREGILRKRMPLIENGVLSNLLFNSYESRAAGRGYSSNASGGASSLPGVGASALSVATGSDSYSDMLKMEQGLIVTRFSSSSNPLTGDFSGVVKGGFLVKNGERRPIEETIIAGNLYECLRSISAISDTSLIMNGTVSMPAMKIEGLSVTAG